METKYAIRCSTEDEARECRKKWYSASWDWIYFIRENQSRPVISYAEAVEKGLLGEKIATVCKACLWKKQVSVFTWPTVCGADFIGDKSYVVDKWWIKMVDCSRCNGTGLEIEHHQLNINTSSIDSVAPSNDFGKSENVVEKIMKEIYNRYNDSMDWDDLDDYDNWYRAGLITAKNICTKHLSDK